jgi:uncharacterized damage-inducible protein DinB
MSELTDALQAGAREIFRDQHKWWREIVGDLDAEALNWRPGGETNSLAVLVAHTFDAERYWTAQAAGITLDRDREAKFQTVAGDAADLLAIIDASADDVDGYLAQLTHKTLTEEIERRGVVRSGAWCLLHALEHSREHAGQAALTRQLFAQRS